MLQPAKIPIITYISIGYNLTNPSHIKQESIVAITYSADFDLSLGRNHHNAKFAASTRYI
jgi:hypothetical protein